MKKKAILFLMTIFVTFAAFGQAVSTPNNKVTKPGKMEIKKAELSAPATIKIDEGGNLIVGENSIKLTPEQLFKVDSMLAKKLGLNDSIAKAKADSLATIGKAEQKAIIDDPTSTKSEKTIATILGALLALLGFISNLFKNKQFTGELAKRFFGETPKFWQKVSWVSAIGLFIFLILIGIDTLFVPFMSATFLSICYYAITIFFGVFLAARFTIKNPPTAEPVEPVK
jgi:hypothetical protein